jgi:dTDP-4-amino-4,6-dideoxyglucose
MTKKHECNGETPVFSKPLEIARPTFPPVEEIFAEFRHSLAAGQVTNNGPWVVRLESALEEYLGVPTLVYSSGQAALLTMLRAAGIVEGEVIVPSLTFSATPHAVVWSGGEPVFADIKDDMSFAIDPDDVERRITPKTVAILSVDPYGIACDYEALTNIGSAPSFGTKVGGRTTGGFGDAQIFSFHATKAFNTMEGGCLCSHDKTIIERARAIRNFGQSTNGDCSIAGLNGKMTEICAIIGIAQLRSFDQAAAIRRHCVARISDGLANIAGLGVARAPTGQDPIWLYLPVTIDPDEFGIDREEVVCQLACQNLRVRKYYSPACHQMSVYASIRNRPSLPITERITRDVIALPIYNDMSDVECDGIVEAFRRIRRKG